MKRCITSRGSTSVAAKKTMQFGIFDFVTVQETNWWGNWQDSKFDGDFIFLWSRGSTSVAAKKTMQFGIFDFVTVQETNWWGNWQVSKFDGDFIFLWKHFSFYEKVPSHLIWSCNVFFWNIFTPISSVMFSTDLHYSVCST